MAELKSEDKRLDKADPGMRPGDERIRLIEDQYGLGTWQLDLANGAMCFSPGLFRLLGLDPQLIRPSASAVEALLHPLDTDLPHGIESCSKPGLFAFRIIRPDGDIRWLSNSVHPCHSREGKVIRTFGIVKDTTALHQARQDAQIHASAFEALARHCSARVGIALEQALSMELAEHDGNRVRAPNSLVDALASCVEDRDQLTHMITAWQVGLASGTPVSSCGIGGGGRAIVTHGIPLVAETKANRQWMWVVAEKPHAEVRAGLPSTADMSLTAAEIRCARGFLDWSAQTLADAAGVSFSSIRRMETDGHVGCRSSVVSAVRNALERAGISFARDHFGQVHIVCAANRPHVAPERK